MYIKFVKLKFTSKLLTNWKTDAIIQAPLKEAKRTTKEGDSIVTLGEILSVSRGLHLLGGERSSDNLKNEGISKAKILTFSDIYEYNYKEENTIKPEGEIIFRNGKKEIRKRTEVFVNLNKRYKNSRPQRFDILLNLKASLFCPRLVYWKDENCKMDYIYSNDTIFLRKSTDMVDPRFIFYIMNTSKVKEYLNVESDKNKPKRISCSIIENIKIELPDIDTQRKIINEINKNETKIENLIG